MGTQPRIGSDEELLVRAEAALTQIKVAAGLSEAHEAVLAALRIRLKGEAGASLEELLAAADEAPPAKRHSPLDRPPLKPATTLDALLADPGTPKPSLDDLLGSGGDDASET